MTTDPDKIYHNITLSYNDLKLTTPDRNTSLAETEINVLDPIIENSNMYDLCISKFRLDTFTIPLVIPELKQPQTIEDSKIDLNYWVKLLVTDQNHVDIEQNTDEGEIEYTMKSQAYLQLNGKHMEGKGKLTKYEITIKGENGNEIKEKETYFSMEDSFKIKKPVIKNIENDSTKGYINNLDPFCYIYEPQEFVESINNAIIEAYYSYFKGDSTNKISEEDFTNVKNFAFFKLEGSSLKFYQLISSIPYIFVFSPNLYKYFGFGFNTKRVDAEGGWMICNDPDSRNFRNENKYCQILASYTNPETEYTSNYNIVECKFGITQTWNACKLILICSANLPIRGEYVPINEFDGLLVHDNTEDARKLFDLIHNGKKSSTTLGENSVKTPSIKVLESFYPASSTGGDMRTQIIYSNESMDTSTKLSFQGEYSALKKFDISVKWVDIYNNIHDLELMPGTSCDIRLGFVKKAVKQDLVLGGFKEILRTLRGEPRGIPPRKKPTSNSFELLNGGFEFQGLKTV